MPYALLSLIWTSSLFLIATVASGLKFWGVDHFMRNHFAAALTATIFALFAHTMTMFYFIGTGKKIKEFVESWAESEQREFRRKIIETKKKLFPHMTFICLVLVMAFLLGGAFSQGLVSRSVHAWVAYGALIYHVHVSAVETLHIFRNIGLIYEVNDRHRWRLLKASNEKSS